MAQFEFATATRIVFGRGTLAQAAKAAQGFGQRVFLVTGGNVGRAERLLGLLKQTGLEAVTASVMGEPTTELVQLLTTQAKAERCDVVIGIGGGSVIDAAKAVSGLLTNEGDLFDYLEVIGKAQPLKHPAAPYIAIPTTAGTGAEVTRNAVLGSKEHRVKVSLRSPLMLPRLAIVDPELTYDLPPDVTAYTGLDALTQVIEPYVCTKANPMTDGWCVEGIRRAAKSLRKAVELGKDADARGDMAVTSLFGGLALANAGLGAVHGFAAPFGGMFSAPHGAVCAALLPHVMAANIKALRESAPRHVALMRYEEIGRLLTGKTQATAEDGVQWVAELVKDLRVPGLAKYGCNDGDVMELVEKASKASSMKANPVELTTAELLEIVFAAKSSATETSPARRINSALAGRVQGSSASAPVNCIVDLCLNRFNVLAIVHKQFPEGTFDLYYFIKNVRLAAEAMFAGGFTKGLDFNNLPDWVLNAATANNIYMESRPHAQDLITCFHQAVLRQSMQPQESFDLAFAYLTISEAVMAKSLWERVLAGKVSSGDFEGDFLDSWTPWPAD
jgi:alcohol dehydrogenase class IV